ncbi:mannan endo-1,6-alpha-mannosidase DCW1 precursor [Pseudovirgaria hyperparasitica]|uniref:Mannan endo-1,6-alpha-mannosidase n=1 Tax=Pseudovirgaria hyperparasitica TaxID=470096 RepID=A0A6A6VSJ4_9PEZI|nr:mannan endo-1,6-alpha-mannosidase DCW1 precursor [Pseudovirgaria hyperparasitica]KAF2753562.1 mannan endo-1,6-alpha-mannosidase DCW1 precursor [Pseudovirgaria hyperparasitica]
MKLFSPEVLGAVLFIASTADAISLTIDSADSVKSAAGAVAKGLTSYYTGYRPGDVPGNLPDPYYWWEAGAMFNALIDYWHYTGDDQYNEIIFQALLHQTGEDDDYMPVNQSQSLGNDDQGFWGMAAMSAAERGFKDPPADQPQWLALAQAVFNTQASRWDTTTCGGGLRWQIFTFNNGYNYKNTISNGCFFNVAARLARYTGNNTYSDWAEKTWDWVRSISLSDDTVHFFDGSDDLKNCSEVNHIQWTYNAGIFMLGAAHMYNYTESETWKSRLDGIIKGVSVFLSPDANNVIYEVACEPHNTCDEDQRSFKAYLARWIGSTMQVAPYTQETLMPILQASAAAAAKVCADDGTCGQVWYTGTDDGLRGVGEQMSALEVMQNLLAPSSSPPLTNTTGGTSIGNPNAGADSKDSPIVFSQVTAGDKAGAGFLTTLVLVGILAGAYWMIAY